MLHLIKMWLEALVEETDEKGNKHRSTRNRDEGKGTPQGAPISPLLSNLYMRRFVLGWKKLGQRLPRCMRPLPQPYRGTLRISLAFEYPSRDMTTWLSSIRAGSSLRRQGLAARRDDRGQM